MKILYCHWGEYTFLNIIDVFIKKGYEIEFVFTSAEDAVVTLGFVDEMREKLKTGSYDCVFSFNFFAAVSEIANEMGVKYVSWVFDSPCLTLYRNVIFNKCNYIFLFDNHEVQVLRAKGAKNVYHMPLGINPDILNEKMPTDIADTRYRYDVSFVGNSWEKSNFYAQVQNIPDYYKGFFDGIMDAQMNIYGYDLASALLTEEFDEAIGQMVNFVMDNDYFIKPRELFAIMLQKQITVKERPEILKYVSERDISLAHFSKKADERLDKVKFMGYVDYDEEMPFVFRESKINLNISLRSILSGIPLRCMDVMGAGGFLLSNYQPELAELFVDGQECVMYSDRVDLVDKIHYYLAHEDERIEIARRGKAKVEKEYSFDVLLDKIFDIVKNGEV